MARLDLALLGGFHAARDGTAISRFDEHVFEAVQRWLAEPGAHDHRHSPLDVVDPLFGKRGMRNYTEGFMMMSQQFRVDPEDTRQSPGKLFLELALSDAKHVRPCL